MWTGRWPLMCSMIAASVVLLPDPVGPVTRKRPCLLRASSFTMAGAPRSSRLGTLAGMRRNTAPGSPFWKKAFPRKRPRPGTANEKSSSLSRVSVDR